MRFDGLILSSLVASGFTGRRPPAAVRPPPPTLHSPPSPVSSTVYHLPLITTTAATVEHQVDFKEFSLVLWNYLSFSPSTLAVFAYGLADEDDSGILEKKEVVALIKVLIVLFCFRMSSFENVTPWNDPTPSPPFNVPSWYMDATMKRILG